MRPQALVAALSAVAVGQVAAQETGAQGDAVAVADNPAGAVFKATLPEKPFSPVAIEGNVKGSIKAVSAVDGKGVQFQVKISNLPKEGGPFMYHLHVDPVGADGNCTKTLAHHDPYIRGEATPCNADKPETCQVGDLSGKWGNITSDPFEATYIDHYATLKPGLGSYFGNRSVVIHFSNKTRITCANFEAVTDHGHDHDDCDDGDEEEEGEEEGGGGKTPSGTGSLPSPSPTKSAVPFTGSAAASGASLMVALAVVMFAL